MYSVQVAFLLELLVQQAFYVYYVHIYVYYGQLRNMDMV